MPIVSWMSERAWLLTMAVLVLAGAVGGCIAFMANHATRARRQARRPQQPPR